MAVPTTSRTRAFSFFEPRSILESFVMKSIRRQSPIENFSIREHVLDLSIDKGK